MIEKQKGGEIMNIDQEIQVLQARKRAIRETDSQITSLQRRRERIEAGRLDKELGKPKRKARAKAIVPHGKMRQLCAEAYTTLKATELHVDKVAAFVASKLPEADAKEVRNRVRNCLFGNAEHGRHFASTGRSTFAIKSEV